MGKFKRVINRLLHPGTAVLVASVIAGTGLLLYTFLVAGEDNPISYVSYVVSAYALTILCVNVIPSLRRGKDIARRNKYIQRYMDDVPFRLDVSLHASLLINLFYAGLNGFSGIYYRSTWFATLAVYYIFLAVMRFLLVRYGHKNGFQGNMTEQLRRYRLCGIMLIMMNTALAGVVILVVSQNRGFQYAGMLIYVMAMYAFYSTITAVVNLVKYRRYNSPVMSAAKAVSFASALVSMLSLETAMLSQFGTGDKADALFRRVMVSSTGGVVCIVVVTMGVYMVVNSTKRLRKVRGGGTEK